MSELPEQEEHRGVSAAHTTATSAKESRKAYLHRRRIRAYKVLLPLLIVIGFLAWGYTTNYIPSESMLPTLKPGDHIITLKSWLAYPGGRAPKRGDIIVFALPTPLPRLDEISDQEERRRIMAEFQEKVHIPPGSLRRVKGDVLIKRVVGLPGETIQVNGKEILIDGTKLDQTYFGSQGEVDPEIQFNFAHLAPLKLKEDEVFVLGDNIENSEDGRYWGPLKRTSIIGRYVGVLWNDGGKKAADGAAASEPASP